jgi:hypothetical protein
MILRECPLARPTAFAITTQSLEEEGDGRGERKEEDHEHFRKAIH